MEAPDFWDNAEASQMKMKQLKSLKDDIETYHNLETQMEDMETMIEMGYEENDPEIVPEIQEMLDEFQASFDSIRVKTLLSGEYDGENAIIKLNAGAGGTEACSQEFFVRSDGTKSVGRCAVSSPPRWRRGGGEG